MRPGVARSASAAIAAGLSAGVTMTRRLLGEGAHGVGEDAAGIHGRLHLPVVGRGEDVGGRTAAQLLSELLRAGEVEGDGSVVGRAEGRPDLLERVGQRGGGEDDDLRAAAPAPSGPGCRADGVHAASPESRPGPTGKRRSSQTIPDGSGDLRVNGSDRDADRFVLCVSASLREPSFDLCASQTAVQITSDAHCVLHSSSQATAARTWPIR